MLVHCAAPPHTQRCGRRRGRTDGADSRRPPSEPDLDGLAGRQLEVARDAERNGLPGAVRRALDASQLRAVAAGQHRAPEALVPEVQAFGPRRSVVFAVQQDARSVRFDAGLRWQRRRRRPDPRHLRRAQHDLVDARSGERFEAVVNYVSPGIDAARGSVELRLDVAQPPALLKSDMTISMDLKGPLLKQALMLPADAVRQLQTEAPWVLVERDGVAAKVAVKTGLQTQGRVEIVDGLKAGDRVILNREVEAGSRVRDRR